MCVCPCVREEENCGGDGGGSGFSGRKTEERDNVSFSVVAESAGAAGRITEWLLKGGGGGGGGGEGEGEGEGDVL